VITTNSPLSRTSTDKIISGIQAVKLNNSDEHSSNDVSGMSIQAEDDTSLACSHTSQPLATVSCYSHRVSPADCLQTSLFPAFKTRY